MNQNLVCLGESNAVAMGEVEDKTSIMPALNVILAKGLQQDAIATCPAVSKRKRKWLV